MMENQKTNLLDLLKAEEAKASSENPFDAIYKVSEFAKVISKNFDVKKAQALFTEEIDYSFINEESFQHFKSKMENHKQRMVLAKHNFLKLKDGEAFDDFCRYVHLQVEGLFNYYAHIIYKNPQALYERNIIYCLDNFLFIKKNANLKLPFKNLKEFSNIVTQLFNFKSGILSENKLNEFLQPLLTTFNSANGSSISVKQIKDCLKFKIVENLDSVEFYIKGNIFHGDSFDMKGKDEFLHYRNLLNDYRNFETSHTNTLNDYDTVLKECNSTIAESFLTLQTARTAGKFYNRNDEVIIPDNVDWIQIYFESYVPKDKTDLTSAIVLEASKKLKNSTKTRRTVTQLLPFTNKWQSKNKIFEMLIDTLEFVKNQKESIVQPQTS